jgi:hypothetical protein
VIDYRAPFIKPQREKDYEIVWDVFAGSDGVQDGWWSGHYCYAKDCFCDFL